MKITHLISRFAILLALICSSSLWAQTCRLPAQDGVPCRTNWKETPIDPSRNQAGNYCDGMNCWKFDDTVRDKLEMNPDQLSFITKLKAGATLPQDGRYIYVYRKSDNQIYVRPYDRNETDKQWMYEGNCRSRTEFGQYRCKTSSADGSYLHVRHSQLNGGWDPVWCAGEARIEKGQFCMANNESGHFKPDAQCLSYLNVTLHNWGIPVASDAIFADFKKASAAETCEQLRKHEHDEL